MSSLKTELVTDSEEFKNKYLNLIEAATSSIVLESYIFQRDSFGSLVFKKLQEAAKRGVSVQVLVDGVGSSQFLRGLLFDKINTHLKIRSYHPLPWPFGPFHKFWWSALLGVFKNINRRNHRKLLLVDGQHAVTGSRNVFYEALIWRENSLFIQGEAVKKLLPGFERIWKLSIAWRRSYPVLRKTPLKKLGPMELAPDSTLTYRNKMQALKQRLKEAKSRVQITTPYFNPPHGVLRALKSAAKRGVKVEIILPKKSDVLLSKWMNVSYYRPLLKTGIHIYEYNPHILHAKSVLIDRFAIVGSSNLNYRSLFRDLELDLIFQEPDFITQLAEQFEEDKSNSSLVEMPPPSSLFYWPLSRLLATLKGSL